MKKKITLIVGILSIFVLMGCKTQSKAPTNPVSVKEESKLKNLLHTQWQLADNVGGSLPTIMFEEKRVSGNASCNNYTAEVEMENGEIVRVKNIATTRKACPKMETEANYLNLLKKVNRYKATSKKLELYQNELLLLKFNRMNK